MIFSTYEDGKRTCSDWLPAPSNWVPAWLVASGDNIIIIILKRFGLVNFRLYWEGVLTTD